MIHPDIPGCENTIPDRMYVCQNVTFSSSLIDDTRLHCMFTRGLKFHGSTSAGAIAMGLSDTPYHAAMLVEDSSKFADNVTIYTNDDAKLSEKH